MQILDFRVDSADKGNARRAVVEESGDDFPAAQRELGATVVVQGSLHKIAQEIHLIVNLIDTKTLRQVGSVAVEDPAGDFSLSLSFSTNY